MQIDQQKRNQVLGALTIGGDRHMAAAYVGWSIDRLEHEIKSDPHFQMQVERAEASAEVTNLKCLQDAVQKGDGKNWRAAMWWLKARMPDRYDRRQNTVNDEELREFLNVVLKIVGEVVGDEQAEQIHGRLTQVLEAQAAR